MYLFYTKPEFFLEELSEQVNAEIVASIMVLASPALKYRL
jgi:hypothetical protein